MLGWTPGSRDRGGPSQSRVPCVLYDLGLLLHLSARVHTHTHTMLSGLIPVSGVLLSSWEGGAQKGPEEWWGLNL